MTLTEPRTWTVQPRLDRPHIPAVANWAFSRPRRNCVLALRLVVGAAARLLRTEKVFYGAGEPGSVGGMGPAAVADEIAVDAGSGLDEQQIGESLLSRMSAPAGEVDEAPAVG